MMICFGFHIWFGTNAGKSRISYYEFFKLFQKDPFILPMQWLPRYQSHSIIGRVGVSINFHAVTFYIDCWIVID